MVPMHKYVTLAVVLVNLCVRYTPGVREIANIRIPIMSPMQYFKAVCKGEENDFWMGLIEAHNPKPRSIHTAHRKFAHDDIIQLIWWDQVNFNRLEEMSEIVTIIILQLISHIFCFFGRP